MAVASGSVPLRGAPDSDIGGPDARSKPVQVMQLELTDDLLEELLKSVRSGKPPQILFGNSPVLRYGSNESRVLDPTPEKFRHELYKAGKDDGEGMAFAGLVNHKLAIREAKKASAGMDSALATLKSSLATLSQEKEARSTTIVDTPDFAPLSGRKAAKAHKKGLLKNPSLLSAPHSLSTSPTLAAHKSPSTIAPTSAPTAKITGSESQKALRTPLLHLLAIEPITLKDISKTTRCKREDCGVLLPKIAREVNSETGEWRLKDRSYTELDVWKFPYPSQEKRQAAIDNAVRAFDRLRFSPDESVWQMLLPKSERGKGKTLSRLTLNTTAAPVPKPTPSMRAKPVGKKAAAAKKTDAKAGEVKTKETKAKEGKAATKAEKAEKAATKEKLEEPATCVKRGNKHADEVADPKPAKSREATATAKKSTKAQNLPSTQPTTTSVKNPTKPSKTTPRASNEKKASSAATKDKMKAPNTKPKTPSPLSSSISASDFEDDHPVHRTLSASPSPRVKPTAVKRKAEHDADLKPTGAKQRKLEHSSALTPNKTTTTPSSSLKRKAAPADDTPPTKTTAPAAKQRKLASTPTTMARPTITSTRATHGVSSSSAAPSGASSAAGSSASSTSSPPLQPSWRQTMAQAQRFQSYYAKYHALYTELADSRVPPSAEKRAELMTMHRKLQELKRQIGNAAEV